MGLSIFEEASPVFQYAEYALADGTAFKQIAYASDGPIRVDAIIITSLAAAAHDVVLQFWSGASGANVGTAHVPAGAGYGSVPAVDLVPALAPVAIGGFLLPTVNQLRLKMAAALGATDYIDVLVLGGTI